MAKKVRLDEYLIDSQMAEDIKSARTLIMTGVVYVNGQKCLNSGTKVSEKDEVLVKDSGCKYVSRGGLKIEKAIREFNIELSGKTAIDVGASTGGFTDCMLKNGAKKVYTIDVGYGQLAWSIRNDPRVVNFERTNIRYVTEEQLGEAADFASIDVSFISLKLVLPVVKELIKPAGEIVALIKPQFEAPKELVGEKGVVSDPLVHLQVVLDIIDFAKKEFMVKKLSYSPIKGPQGNIEYLLYLSNTTGQNKIDIKLIKDTIDKSHSDKF